LVDISFFHLLTHAIFKSLLFLCAGVIIHNIINNQDIRYIRITLYNLPLVRIIFNCSSISLCGIPFLSGFFSKDLILEIFLISKFNKFIILILFISIGLTIIYTIRLIFYSFIKIPQLIIYINYNIILSKIGISIYLLFIFSIIKGRILRWLLFSIKNFIYLTKNFKILIYLIILLGILLGLLIINLYIKLNLYKYCAIYIKIFIIIWFIPLLYINYVPKILYFSNKIIFRIELGWLEYFIKNNIIYYIIYIFKLEYFNKNYLIILIIIIFIIIIIIY